MKNFPRLLAFALLVNAALLFCACQVEQSNVSKTQNANSLTANASPTTNSNVAQQNVSLKSAPSPSASPNASPSPAPSPAAAPAPQPNWIPNDTRVVVNAPAFRMDVFDNGRLVKSYRVGIGYPEFPLQIGMREASVIIFNPTWTPPNEPWVGGSKVGATVEAGASNNPLGLVKIPIGAPALIHGGKAPAKIGNFASHGCVGMTNPQVQSFARTLAAVGGSPVTDADIARYAQRRTETKNVKLPTPVPVEIRYETIVIEDGRLHIYRDVYGYGSNTGQNLRKVLQTYNISLDQFSAEEREKTLSALKLMARDWRGRDANSAPRKINGKSKTPGVSYTIAGQKEITIDVAALAGKGYPAPVGLETGSSPAVAAPRPKAKTAKPRPKPTPNAPQQAAVKTPTPNQE